MLVPPLEVPLDEEEPPLSSPDPWSSPVVDPASGNVFAISANGLVMSLSKDGKLLWERSLAEEMGMFKKYDLDFEFVYIPSSSTATAALLGGNVDVGLLGGIGVVNAFVNGATDLVLIGSIKNFMTQSILAKPEITKLQELKGKKIGVTKIATCRMLPISGWRSR